MAANDGGIPKAIVTPPNAAGIKVINQAKKYIGVVENPPLSNHGKPHPYDWQNNFGLGNQDFSGVGEAWCGCFAASMFMEAGVDDEDLGDPSVENIWNKAAAMHPRRTSTQPVMGCYVIFGEWNSDGTIAVGHHVELFIRWHNLGRREIVCIGGNTAIDLADTNDGVVCHVRSILRPNRDHPTWRLKFVVPRALTVIPASVAYA